jgi:ureidoglycolate hydrolase
MDENWLEIREFTGEGYKPLIDYGKWRVAFLRYLDEELLPERIDSMERHIETDEVFVLLQGRAVLLLGGNGTRLDGVFPQFMEGGKLYNVKRNAWHAILLSRDATILLVENRDTGEKNSEQAALSADQRRQIVELARREQIQA